MGDPNRDLLKAAVRVLQPVLDDLVFLGGSVTGLLLTDPASAGLRSTTDVDVITEVPSYAEYARLSERLRALGLTEDTSQGAPLCRWRQGALVIDVMPTVDQVLGFANRWYIPAFAAAKSTPLDGFFIRVITADYFLATKLEAFHARGQGDVGGSHDLEDVIAVIDGRPEIIEEVQSALPDVRRYLATTLQRLMAHRAFIDALPGFLLPDSATQARLPILVERLTALASYRV
jgi:hypothetical protein